MLQGVMQRMAWLHTWLGLCVGWLAYFVFVLGSVAYFDTEIDRWMRPELPLRTSAAQAIPSTQSIVSAYRYLDGEPLAEGAQVWEIVAPQGHEVAHLSAGWRQPQSGGRMSRGISSGTRLLDYDGTPLIAPRATGGGYALYRLHVQLHYLPRLTGFYLTGICAMAVLLCVFSGIVLHKRLLRDLFLFRPDKRARSWLDAHTTVGTMAIPYLIFMAYSGLVFLNSSYLPWLVDGNFGDNGRSRYIATVFPRHAIPAPAGIAAPTLTPETIFTRTQQHWGGSELAAYTIWNPGDANARIGVERARHGVERGNEQLLFDGVSGELLEAREAPRSTPRRVYDAILGIHEGNFAPGWLRALYFAAGLLGSSVIATGSILWVHKRLPRHAAQRPTLGCMLAQRLNVGVFAGLPIALAAYFWANRLLSADFETRAAWEMHALFLTWGICLLFGLFRSPARSWRELCVLAAAAYLLLPLLNGLCSERHLGVTLPAGDWGLAGIDLALLLIGIVFGALAWWLDFRRRRSLPHRADPLFAPAGFGGNRPC
ncbi:MAG TPA: PepSY-associated TM helix domain-containing protein [Hyphomicrobiales bacterium]|nr:PepSY-associated TM helix domain-containing protein [Hyphomicrobiales bacterium]